jgi:NAD(P)-dependent dehydrogenase (short-subunit alcohol dehydrogenase family)
MRLTGKQALVTGSSRGIGQGIALRLAREGAVVAVHYFRNHEAAAETLAQVRELGSDGVIVQGDLSLADDIRRIFAELRDTFGTLDVFVSSAPGESPAFLLAVPQAASLMPSGGRIIAITAGTPQTALDGTVRQFAVALAPRGITVNAIIPGPAADAGSIVALLCSDEAATITGNVIAADGGASVRDAVSPGDTRLTRIVAAN